MNLVSSFIRHLEESLSINAQRVGRIYFFTYLWDQESYETLFNLVWIFWGLAGFEVSEDEVPSEMEPRKALIFSANNEQACLVIFLQHHKDMLSVSVEVRDKDAALEISQYDLRFLRRAGLSLQ